MDSTTQAHLDPSIMTHTQQQGQIPHLGVASPAEVRAATLDSSSPLYSSNAQPGVHTTTERIVPSGQSYPDSSPNPYQSGSSGLGASSHSSSGNTNAHANANQAVNNVADSANRTVDQAANSANQAKNAAQDTAKNVNAKAVDAKNNIAANVEPAVQGLRTRVNQLGSQATEVTHQVAEHPVVQNAKQSAEKQVGQFREFLGNFPIVKELEKRTGVDRVALVACGVFAYLLLVPFNLFGLALPVTQFLTFVPPTVLALDILERKGASVNDEDTKTVLAYFVVLGFIQSIESLAPGVLARRIPQYWTVKLIFLAYLIHPQTKGALKIHNNFLRNFVNNKKSSSSTSSSSSMRSSAAPGYSTSAGSQSTQTPPTSNPFNGASQASSPTFSPRVVMVQDTPQLPHQNVPVLTASGQAIPATSTANLI